MAAVRVDVSKRCGNSAVTEQAHDGVDTLLVVIMETTLLLDHSAAVANREGSLTPKTTLKQVSHFHFLQISVENLPW